MTLKEWFNRVKEKNPSLEHLQEKVKQWLSAPPHSRGLWIAPPPGGPHGGPNFRGSHSGSRHSSHPGPQLGPYPVPKAPAHPHPSADGSHRSFFAPGRPNDESPPHMIRPYPRYENGYFGAFPPGPSPLFGPDPYGYPVPGPPESDGRHDEEVPTHNPRGSRLTDESQHVGDLSPAPTDRRPPIFPPGPPPFAGDEYSYPPSSPESQHRDKRVSDHHSNIRSGGRKGHNNPSEVHRKRTKKVTARSTKAHANQKRNPRRPHRRR